MSKFMAQNMNTMIRAAYLTQLPAISASLYLFTGDMPDHNALSHVGTDFTLLAGTLATPKAVSLGALHNHDAEYDAFHINAVEFIGDNAEPGQAATGYFISGSDELENVILYAEEFVDPLLFQDALSAYTILPKILLQRKGVNVETQIIQ